ncbi:hypothetical protein [Enterobacter kobei]|uniref:Uncharacterized protein n=2 Tax=Enterobacter kobei TaxID=208224 RepID=A0ACC8SCX3_9ENTR|nr:hypothetical protein [Enterobacter kobei]OLR21368.1 hypothetical protein BH713_12260 [Enterobacter kobei]BCU55261.1 hypothetical protein ENKO_18550 [Enterobacter kobei]SIQ91307.1 hypothetical protein SAMN05444841_102456 [Enterobacter kobei]
MKEQMAKMTIIELVKTAHNYATSIKQTGVYSDLVGEIASRLEALNLAYIGLTKKSNGMQSERDQLAAQLADVVAENGALLKFCKDASFDADYEAELGMERGGFTDAINDIKTPATDRFIAEQRAHGVEMLRDSIAEVEISIEDTIDLHHFCSDFAAQLRNEVKG